MSESLENKTVNNKILQLRGRSSLPTFSIFTKRAKIASGSKEERDEQKKKRRTALAGERRNKKARVETKASLHFNFTLRSSIPQNWIPYPEIDLYISCPMFGAFRLGTERSRTRVLSLFRAFFELRLQCAPIVLLRNPFLISVENLILIPV